MKRKVTWLLVCLFAIPFSFAVEHETPEETGTAAPAAILDCSAIGQLLKLNKGKAPTTGVELRALVEQLGPVVDFGVPFSDAPEPTDLINTRVVMAVDAPQSYDDDGRKSNYAGKLYLGSNLHWDPKAKKMVTKKTEFISWNERDRRFDFGIIENIGTPNAKVVLADRKACMACHKNGGPMLQPFPWSNSVAIAATKEASLQAFRDLDPQFAGVHVRTEMDGTFPFRGSDEDYDFDQLVRRGVGMMRGSERLASVPPGVTREGLSRTMLRGVLGDAFAPSPSSITEGSAFDKYDVSGLPSSKSDALRNFNPVDLVKKGAVDTEDAAEAMKKNVAFTLEYNKKRISGDLKLPQEYVPSNPAAFLAGSAIKEEETDKAFNGPTGKWIMGFTQKEDTLLSDIIDEALNLVDDKNKDLKPRPGYMSQKSELIGEIISSPEFRPYAAAGRLPDPRTLFARLKTVIPRVLKEKYGITHKLPKLAAVTASPSPCEPVATSEPKAQPVPHACNRCHTGVGVSGRMVLAFDPFNVTAREKWVKENDKGTVRKKLERLRKYVTEYGTMPPNGEPEWGWIDKNPKEWAALKKFVETELGKVKE